MWWAGAQGAAGGVKGIHRATHTAGAAGKSVGVRGGRVGAWGRGGGGGVITWGGEGAGGSGAGDRTILAPGGEKWTTGGLRTPAEGEMSIVNV
jgi:hypothetical protein